MSQSPLRNAASARVRAYSDPDLTDRWRQSGYWLDTTLAALTARHADAHGDRIMVVEGDARYTCGAIVAEARRLASALLTRGFGPGSVISYQIPNWHEGNVINLAASMIGAAVNPLLPMYRDNEVSFMLDDIGTDIMFVPEEFRGCAHTEMMLRVGAKLNRELTVVSLRSNVSGCVGYADLIASGSPDPNLPAVDPDSIFIMMHTSGTTGRPKCVLHSHNSFLALMRIYALELRASDADVQIVGSPISHVTGIILANLTPLVGAKVILMERWSAEQAIALIRSQSNAVLSGATPFIRQLLDAASASGHHLPSLSRAILGGAAVQPDLIRDVQAWFPNAISYRLFGCSEVPTVTSGANSREDITFSAETDGRIEHTEVRIVDAVSGAPLPDGEEGEILLRGPQMMRGYLRDEDNDAAFDADGFFATGDLGRKVQGRYLRITGRKKDLIIRSGENISPREIEDALHTHPAIAAAAVVSMPHPRTGECGCAFLVLRQGCSIDLPEIDSFLRATGLARQKVPEHLEIVDTLPMSAQGKILKTELRKIAAELASSAVNR